LNNQQSMGKPNTPSFRKNTQNLAGGISHRSVRILKVKVPLGYRVMLYFLKYHLMPKDNYGKSWGEVTKAVEKGGCRATRWHRVHPLDLRSTNPARKTSEIEKKGDRKKGKKKGASAKTKSRGG